MSKIPSIAMIPSAYKSGKLYSVLPSDGSGDLNFARTSEATRVNQNGLIETVGSNVPRLNYPLIDGVVSGCPSLLLEPQRTNIIPYSEDFSQWWSLNNVTQFSNQTISPNGTLNADKITIDNSNSLHYIATAGNFIDTGVTTDKVFSVFVKKNEITRIGIVDLRYLNGLEVEFNLETKSIGRKFGNLFVDASIEEFNNDWLRCNVVYDTEPLTSMSIVLLDDNYNSSTKIRDYTYQGDGSSSFYVWGAQLEQGSYPTSYIPTNGATATRNAETSSKANISNLINSSEGVLYLETKGFIDTQISSEYIQLSKNGETGFNNSLVIQHRNNGFLRIYANGSDTIDIHFNINIDFTKNHKIAVLYKLNGYKLFIDGVSQPIYLTPTQTVFSGLDTLSFDFRGALGWNGSIKDLRVYNTSLTDQELIALTS